MKTVVLKLEDTAIGNFEKLGSYRFALTQAVSIGNDGEFRLMGISNGLSQAIFVGGEFYEDAALTSLIGTTYNVKAGYNIIYFKITASNPYIELTNIYNIRGLGTGSYLFGNIGTKAGAIMPTSDLYKFPNLSMLCISRSELTGLVSEIPESVQDLRLEYRGLIGTLADLKSDIYTHLRLLQANMTGNYSQLSGKNINVLITELPLVSGDLIDLLNIVAPQRIAIGNDASRTLATMSYPVTSSLTQNMYFPSLRSFCAKNVFLDRTPLLNTIKSLTQTKWTAKDTVVLAQVQLTTTMKEADYNADTEIQSAVNALNSVITGGFVINFA